MNCPACGTRMVDFAVPAAYRGAVPGGGAAAAICPDCLTLVADDVDETAVSRPEHASFSRIIDGFPPGEVGVAMALAVGLMVESLALNRDAVEVLFDAVSDAGEDPWLVLERLAVAGAVRPDADLGKLREQLEQLWG